jgi:hypothetical protein
MPTRRAGHLLNLLEGREELLEKQHPGGPIMPRCRDSHLDEPRVGRCLNNDANVIFPIHELLTPYYSLSVRIENFGKNISEITEW